MTTNPVIHIFNPETDYALAAGNSTYNPPASIATFRKRMALFPASFASRNDYIAVADDVDIPADCDPGHQDLAAQKGISIVRISDLHNLILSFELAGIPVEIQPWGWNFSLVNTLLKAGVSPHLLKRKDELDKLRLLSHRRTAADFNRLLQAMLPDLRICPAREFTSADEAMAFASDFPGAFFKAPWSSSGRGVVREGSLSPARLREWIGGCIRRQGSVMAEIPHRKVDDFASEWHISDGKSSFLGLSFFKTTPDGRYLENISGDFDSLESLIKQHCREWSRDIIEAQRKILDSLIAPHYNGPAGIDMLSTEDGGIVPCVEINLRQTMGLATLLSRNSND